MSDELEKTIEELEAEVLAELEEAEDATKKGAAPAEELHSGDPARYRRRWTKVCEQNCQIPGGCFSRSRNETPP